MLHCNVKKGNGRNTIYVSGSLTIRYISEIRELLLELCGKDEDIVLNLTDVTEVDLSGLQLLCSTEKSFEEGGRKMMIDSDYPDALIKAIEDTGYTYNEVFNVQNIRGGNDV